jgi:hypothetical protein
MEDRKREYLFGEAAYSMGKRDEYVATLGVINHLDISNHL